MKAIEANTITREVINKVKDTGDQLNDCLKAIEIAAKNGEFELFYYGNRNCYNDTIKQLEELGYSIWLSGSYDSIHITWSNEVVF